MLQTYDDLHAARGELIEQSKSKYFVWKQKWKQGNKIIEDIKVNISINNIEVKEVLCKKSEKTLGVHVSPLIKWEDQFNVMVEKMKEVIYKLRKVEIAALIAYLYYNAYLIKKVHFGSGVMALTEKQEIVLKQIYEPVLLRKMNLSEKFPRSVLYSRKKELGIELLALKTIIGVLALKLCIGN